MIELAEHIKSTLSMHQVAEFYGYKPNHRGFINCPFHNEKTASLKMYKQAGRGFHCFGCHTGGSVIDFVMNIYALSFMDAVKKMNEDFGLGFDISKPNPGKVLRFRNKRKKEKAFNGWIDNAYDHLSWYHMILWNTKMRNNPNEIGEINDLYVQAINEIDFINCLCDYIYKDPIGFYKTYREVVGKIADTRELRSRARIC